jgi:CRP-like cAMP-binding protein
MANTTNRLLESLPSDERAALRPILSNTVLKQHTILFEVRDTIETVYFPFDAVVSLVVPLSDGTVIETAMVGHDGLCGGGAVLDGRVAFVRAIVQLEGNGQQCPLDAIKAKLPACPTLNNLIGRHEQVLMAQAQQSAACNVTHQLESRLARWLLRARDLSGSDELFLTQEYLAEMLGVGRTSVSITAHTLQQSGVLKYTRGHIRIVDVDALKDMACECYEAVKLHYETLRGPGLAND